MRLSFGKLARQLVVAGALIPFATCSDFTGPSGSPAVRVNVAPTFSAAASFAKALYSAAGIDFDRVRVLIVRGQTEVLKDTTVAFVSTQSELTLPLVVAAVAGEQVQVTLEYRQADLILYSGTATVTTQPLASPTAPTPTPIVLVPVGPGASAESVEISPASGSFVATQAVSFSAQAFSSGHTAIANPIFGWSVNDPTIATVNSQGLVTPTNKGGTVKVRATTLNEKFAEATVTFFTVPASLALQSGGGQTGMAGNLLAVPAVVKVLDANGNAVPGATVNFAVATGGGTITVINAVSDASGLVSVRWTLGDVVGPQSITATAPTLPNAPLTINATATERPAVALAFVQQPTNSLMNAAIQPAVTVKAIDDKGRTVAGFTGAITIAIETNPTSATLGGTKTINAVSGVATYSDLTLSAAGNGFTLKATALGLTAITSAAFNVGQTPSGLSLVAGGSQTAVIRSTLSQIKVKVADANGIGVPNVTVAFAVAAGGGSIVIDNATTDAEGHARVTWTLGNTVGPQSITATVTGLTGSPLTIGAEGTALPAVKLAFGQQPTNVVINTTMSPAVTAKALDVDGNVVTTFTGTISLGLLNNPNGATLAGTTTIAAVNGVATFANLALNAAGSGYALKASSVALTEATSSTFVVAPPPPASLQFSVQPSNVLENAVMTPSVQVTVLDAGGNLVPGATNAVTLSLNPSTGGLGGTLTVNAVNGVATLGNLTVAHAGTGYTLAAVSTGLTGATSSGFAVTVPPPTAMIRNWTGAVSSKWLEANNWSPAGIPSNLDTAVVPSGVTITPIIDSTATAKLIVIEATATLKINSLVGPVLTDSITNKGTLDVINGIFTGVIDNRSVLSISGTASVPRIRSASTATTRIKGALPNNAALLVGTTLLNAGTLELTDVDGAFAEIIVQDSLVNSVGGTILVSQGAGGDRVISAVLKNYGTLTVNSSEVLTLAHPATGSCNTGSINIAGGGDLFETFPDSMSTFTNTGTMSMGMGAWHVQLGKLSLRSGSVAGSGRFIPLQSQLDIDFSAFSMTMRVDADSRFAGGGLSVPSGKTVTITASDFAQSVNVLGSLRVANLDGGGTVFAGGLSIGDNGTVDLYGDAKIGSIEIGGAGTFRVFADGGPVTATIAKGFTNKGLIELSSTVLAQTNLQIEADTLINDGTITAVGGFGGERRILGLLDNRGTINVDPGSYLTLKSDGGAIRNTGSIVLRDAPTPEVTTAEHSNSLQLQPIGTTMNNFGTIAIGSNRAFYLGVENTLVNEAEGKIVGTGKFRAGSARFVNKGVVAPGDFGKIGTLTYEGDWDAGDGGTIAIELGSAGNDRLVITGAANFAETMNVSVLSGYTPPFASFSVVQYSSFTGRFGTINFPPAILYWTENFGQTGLTISRILGF